MSAPKRRKSRMHLRFRRRIPITKHLHANVSRRGVSLSAHWGIFSRSWGTQRDSTTVDVPGHFGLFWRKDTAAHRELHPFWKFGLFLVFVEFLVSLVRLNVQVGQHCHRTGHPNIQLIVLVVVQFISLYAARSLLPKLGGLPVFGVFVLSLYLHWIVFGSWILPSLHCS